MGEQFETWRNGCEFPYQGNLDVNFALVSPIFFSLISLYLSWRMGTDYLGYKRLLDFLASG